MRLRMLGGENETSFLYKGNMQPCSLPTSVLTLTPSTQHAQHIPFSMHQIAVEIASEPHWAGENFRGWLAAGIVR